MKASAILTCLAAVAMAAPVQITMNPGVEHTSRKQAHPRGASTMYARLDPVDDHLILYNCTELARGGIVECHRTKLNTTLSGLYEPVKRYESLIKGTLAFFVVWLCAYLGIELALCLLCREEQRVETQIVIEPSQVLSSDQISNVDEKIPNGDDKTSDGNERIYITPTVIPNDGYGSNYRYGSNYGYGSIYEYGNNHGNGRIYTAPTVMPNNGSPDDYNFEGYFPRGGNTAEAAEDATYARLNDTSFTVLSGTY